MNPNKALWEKGDFTRIAESMRESGETLVKDSELQRGSRFWISDAAMERRHCRRRDSERTCWVYKSKWASTSSARSNSEVVARAGYVSNRRRALRRTG